MSHHISPYVQKVSIPIFGLSTIRAGGVVGQSRTGVLQVGGGIGCQNRLVIGSGENSWIFMELINDIHDIHPGGRETARAF